jgi:hypothetical protein
MSKHEHKKKLQNNEEAKHNKNSVTGHKRHEVQPLLDKFLDNLTTSFGGVSTRDHTNQLSNSHIPAVQRQMMAKQIGQIGGNQYLSRILLQMNGNQDKVVTKSKVSELNKKAIIQRTPSRDPSQLSEEQLEDEILSIRQWLLNPQNETHPDRDWIEAEHRQFEVELMRRSSQAHTPQSSLEESSSMAVDPTSQTQSAILASGVAIGIPLSVAETMTGGTIAGEATVGGAAASSGNLTVGSIAAPIAAFLLILLWPASTQSGEDEMRQLEEIRRRMQGRQSGGTRIPETPDPSHLIQTLQNVRDILGVGTMLAISAEELERHKQRIQGLFDQIQELIRNNPRLTMLCSAEVIAFRRAVQTTLDYLESGDVDNFVLIRKIDEITSAMENLLACFGVQ